MKRSTRIAKRDEIEDGLAAAEQAIASRAKKEPSAAAQARLDRQSEGYPESPLTPPTKQDQ